MKKIFVVGIIFTYLFLIGCSRQSIAPEKRNTTKINIQSWTALHENVASSPILNEQKNKEGTWLIIEPIHFQTLRSQYNLKTVEGRQSYYDYLITQETSYIFTDLDWVISREDPDELWIVVDALGYTLRNGWTQADYTELFQRLYQESQGIQNRLYIIGILQSAATPEATKLLLEYIQSVEWGHIPKNANNDSLFKASLESIRIISMQLVNGGRNWAISPILKDAWLKLGYTDAIESRIAISKALVYVWEPGWISVLINIVNLDHLSVNARKVTLNALTQLDTNDAVPVLGRALNQSTPNTSSSDHSDVSQALLKWLISVGSADSIKEVMEYLKNPTLSQQMKDQIMVMLKERDLPGEALKMIKAYEKK